MLFSPSEDNRYVIWRGRNNFYKKDIFSWDNAKCVWPFHCCSWHQDRQHFPATHVVPSNSRWWSAACKGLSLDPKNLLYDSGFAFPLFSWPWVRGKEPKRNFEISRTPKNHWMEEVGSPSHLLLERPQQSCLPGSIHIRIK